MCGKLHADRLWPLAATGNASLPYAQDHREPLTSARSSGLAVRLTAAAAWVSSASAPAVMPKLGKREFAELVGGDDAPGHDMPVATMPVHDLPAPLPADVPQDGTSVETQGGVSVGDDRLLKSCRRRSWMFWRSVLLSKMAPLVHFQSSAQAAAAERLRRNSPR